MSISQQQQFNSLSSQVFNSNTFHSESISSQDRVGMAQNAQFRQKQLNHGNSIFSASNNVSFETDNYTSTAPSNISTMITVPTANQNSNNDRCHKHPYKREKFCSICAVNYAKGGHHVELIVNVQSIEKEINQYMNQMMNVNGILSLLMNCLDTKQEQIKDHYKKQTQQMHDIFIQIEKAIYDQKTQLLSQINHKMWESINNIELKKNEARIFEQKLLLKKQDIDRNYTQVTTQMGISEVRNVLDFYNQELDSIKSAIDDVFKSTSFDLVVFNQNQSSQVISVLQTMIQQEIIKPQIMVSYLSETLNVSPNQRNSLSKNESNQLSRFMTNLEKKGSGKKQQLNQEQVRGMSQQTANYQNMDIINKQQVQQKQIIPQYYLQQINEQFNSLNSNNTNKKEYNTYEQQNQQIQSNQQQYIEINDISISEKQQTQESDDLSQAQCVLQNMHNQSKISNKSNMSSYKIINYSDIHEEPNINIMKDNSSPPAISQKQSNSIRESKVTPIPQEKKQSFPYQCISPQTSSKGEIQYRQQFSINKEKQLGQKQRQIIQTEPTHLPANKNKQMVGKLGNHQRNLLMNDDTSFANNKFKLNQTSNSNFNLINQFNKQSTINSPNLVNISPNSNSNNNNINGTKSSEQQQSNQNYKGQPVNCIRQLQLNLVDQENNQKSLTSRVIQNSNGQNMNNAYMNSLTQNQSNNIVAQLIQQKQQQQQQILQNSMKSGQYNHFQQQMNADYTNQSIIKN